MFQYLNTPGGLAQWFADDVNVDSSKVLSFSIDGEIIYGKIVSQKQNEYIKIEYLDENKKEVEDDEDDAPVAKKGDTPKKSPSVDAPSEEEKA